MNKHIVNMLLAFVLGNVCFIGGLVAWENAQLMLLFLMGTIFSLIVYAREYSMYLQERRR